MRGKMRLLFLSLIIAFAASAPAFADTFVMQVRGINPAIPTTMATCNENNRPCFLTLPSAEKGADPINVAADFMDKAARFEFMQQNTLLPVSNDGGTVITMPLEQAQIVPLFDPETVQKPSLMQKPVMRNGRVIATVEVLAFRQKQAD